jgi:hypothetical protein
LITKLDNDVLIQGFGTTDGRAEDVSKYRADICGNTATFTFFTFNRKIYGFSPPSIEHVCDNQSAISATWKDENIIVFDKTKPDADVAKVARSSISNLQIHSNVNTYLVEGHSDKRGTPFSPHE